jgi:uncharacterized protein (DUF58 family)
MPQTDPIRIESSGSSFLTLKLIQAAAVVALTAGLVAARLEVILLAALVLASVNVARFWCRTAARACRLEVALSRSRLYPGEQLAITVRAANPRLLPIWVRAAVPDSQGTCGLSGDRTLAPEARPALLAGETGLLAFQQVSWEQQLSAGRRGVYELGPVRLEAGDLLGFFRHRREEPERLELIVYPRLVPLEALRIPVREFFGSRRARTAVEDPTMGAGTRDYIGNRPARHIHWKASARLVRLQEKIYEPTAQASVLFLLDALSFPEDEPSPGEIRNIETTSAERVFEGALEVVASLAVALDRCRIPVGLALNGTLLGRPERVLPPGRGPYQLSGLLEMLARLTRGGNGTGTGFTATGVAARGLLVGATTTCLYVCCRLTHARALEVETLQMRTRAPFIVLFAGVPSAEEPPDVARFQEEGERRATEHLAAAGIRTVRLSELAADGAPRA